MPQVSDAERQRIEQSRNGQKNWRRWGPYLSERQWGTVREDYSRDGDAWGHFTHDQARSRAYRWEKGAVGGASLRSVWSGNTCGAVAGRPAGR